MRRIHRNPIKATLYATPYASQYVCAMRPWVAPRRAAFRHDGTGSPGFVVPSAAGTGFMDQRIVEWYT